MKIVIQYIFGITVIHDEVRGQNLRSIVLWISYWGQSTEYVACWRAEDGQLKKFDPGPDELYQPMGMINSPLSESSFFNGIWFSSYVVLGAGSAGI